MVGVIGDRERGRRVKIRGDWGEGFPLPNSPRFFSSLLPLPFSDQYASHVHTGQGSGTLGTKGFFSGAATETGSRVGKVSGTQGKGLFHTFLKAGVETTVLPRTSVFRGSLNRGSTAVKYLLRLSEYTADKIRQTDKTKYQDVVYIISLFGARYTAISIKSLGLKILQKYKCH